MSPAPSSSVSPCAFHPQSLSFSSFLFLSYFSPTRGFQKYWMSWRMLDALDSCAPLILQGSTVEPVEVNKCWAWTSVVGRLSHAT